MKRQVIFVCYDINLRNYFTSKNIKWLITGLNQTNGKSFWVYDNTDKKIISILEQWRNKKISLD